MLTQTWQLVTGAALAAIGSAQAVAHTASFDPMAAYWCRSGDLAIADPGLAASIASALPAHCWGCHAAAAGAAILCHAGYRAWRNRSVCLRSAPVSLLAQP
jgi:hypothetical protein